MVTTKMINNDIHKYLEKTTSEEYFAATETLLGLVLLNKNPQGEELRWYKRLMEYYTTYDKDFRTVVDNCVDYLYKKYKDESIQYKNGDVISGKDMFARAQKRGIKVRAMQKVSEETF